MIYSESMSNLINFLGIWLENYCFLINITYLNKKKYFVIFVYKNVVHGINQPWENDWNHLFFSNSCRLLPIRFPKRVIIINKTSLEPIPFSIILIYFLSIYTKFYIIDSLGLVLISVFVLQLYFILDMLFMNAKKISGPKTVPCGNLSSIHF